jgi:hypothetical protein
MPASELNGRDATLAAELRGIAGDLRAAVEVLSDATVRLRVAASEAPPAGGGAEATALAELRGEIRGIFHHASQLSSLGARIRERLVARQEGTSR